MYSLKLAVCAKRVIPFDTIIVSAIACHPNIANSHPFSSSSMSRTRGSVGLYSPIIFTMFSSRSILSITLQEVNICCTIFSAVTCPKTHQLVHKWGQEDWMHCHDKFLFNRPIYNGAALEQILIFVQKFRFQEFALGQSPSSGVNIWGCEVEQTCILSMPGSLLWSGLERGVHVGILRGLMPQMPSFHL